MAVSIDAACLHHPFVLVARLGRGLLVDRLEARRGQSVDEFLNLRIDRLRSASSAAEARRGSDEAASCPAACPPATVRLTGEAERFIMVKPQVLPDVSP